MKYIYSHLGLGDQIVCNGLIRHFSNLFGEVTIFVKNHNYETLKNMYRDNLNIFIMKIGTHQDADSNVQKFIREKNLDLEVIRIGFLDILSNYGELGFDSKFYIQHGLNSSAKWDMFKYERNSEEEKKIFNHYEVKEGEYIFIHDDERYRIDLNRISNPRNLKIVKPIDGLTNNLFNYSLLIEKADSVHTIESSFQFMIDCMCLNLENYVHRYLRPLSNIEIPMYRSVKQIYQ